MRCLAFVILAVLLAACAASDTSERDRSGGFYGGATLGGIPH